jgi:hypothetical protein
LAGKAAALSLFQQLLPTTFWDLLRRQARLRQNNRVYTLSVVMWLMISQWLEGHSPLDHAVAELLRGLPDTFWPRPCKRLQDARSKTTYLSANTAAYNQARHGVPLSVVERSCDHIFEQLTKHTDGSLPPLGQRAFFFDGTSVRLPASQTLQQHYPPGSNQLGQSHWPLLRLLVAHDLKTGLAMRPQWGPASGQQAVSEQQLLDAAIHRLPAASLVVGDANFGVFSVAYAATRRNHPVLLRLTAERARRLAGGQIHDGIDRWITWQPTSADRRNHPDLPKDACVHGRLWVCLVQPSNQANPFLLAIFTTWDASLQQILEVYGQRWNIETDLRTLKSTLHMEQLRCTSPDMVAKELDLAMAAYNLVRAVIYLAAQKAGLPPRAYSFSRVRTIMQVLGPALAAAKTPGEARDIADQILHYVAQAKLPNRTRKRPSYPRETWKKSAAFPTRKNEPITTTSRPPKTLRH